MKALITSLVLTVLISASAFAADDCSLDALSSVQNDFAPQIKKEIQEGCSVTAEAFPGQCCKKANDFVAKNPVPCDSKQRLRYQVNLALTVCNKVSGGSSSCIEEMAYGIADPKIKSINDSCDEKAQSAYNTDAGAIAQYPIFGALTNAPDPQADHDVTFADCQESQLKRLRKQLDSELQGSEVDVASCEQGSQLSPQAGGSNYYPVVPTGIDTSVREPSALKQQSKR